MRNIRPYTVMPHLPQRIQGLKDIAYNLWWTWTQTAREMFIRIDPNMWETCGHNPVALLGRVSQERLNQAAADEGFLAHLDRVQDELAAYMKAKTWYDKAVAGKSRSRIAYFSAEFGLHECLPIYSGGLGILAGDHMKSASALGLPLTGVGLAYYNGYFRQYLNADGWQQEFLQFNDFHNMPCSLERGADGKPVRVSIWLLGKEVYLQAWRVQIGRVRLILLDTRLEENKIEDRSITDQLYGGDHEHRVRQEFVLGIGGYRMLRALGIEPDVCHMNEGHAAMLAVERVRILVEEKGMTFDQAREAVIPGNIFTTHTPVPAGIDRFDPNMMDRYFSKLYGRLRIDRRTFLAMGRQKPHEETEPFNMAVFALKNAGYANGVSALHGEVSRKMFKDLWPEVPESEVPITSITNGVHVRSVISSQLDELFRRYAGANWAYEAGETDATWKGPELIPDAELWRAHERRRARLVTWARQRLKVQLKRRNASPKEIEAADEVLDPEALTIGFARRFATYKRATLIFKDVERLLRITSNKQRPVQIVFAGKAHPKDEPGKRFIQEITHWARDERFRMRMVFIEDYDINVARYLVQGVDVWLNNPRRPLEASGTSGMKAAANGALNCSILDGWWCEGYDGDNGFAIGQGEEYADEAYQDYVESRGLYDLLEKEIIPLFYTRGNDELPRGWIKRMKRAMQTCIPVFSTLRMVRDYAEKFYLPASERHAAVAAENNAGAKELWDWKMSLYQRWAQVRIESVETPPMEQFPIGKDLEVTAKIHLGPIKPDWVEVQAYSGQMDDTGKINNGQGYTLKLESSTPDGMHTYRGKVPCTQAGRFGYTVRVLPCHANLASKFIPGLITWG